MPIESTDYRISPQNYRAGLGKAYQMSPGKVGSVAVLAIMQSTFDLMIEMHNKLTTSPFNVEGDLTGMSDTSKYTRENMARNFIGWNNRARRLGRRMAQYWEDVREPELNPKGNQVIPGFYDTEIVGPIFRGQWPEIYYIGLTKGQQADALEMASLWNMVASVKELMETMEWDSVDAMLIELANRATTQVNVHMPGEDPTFRDDADKIIEKTKEVFRDVWRVTKDAGMGFIYGAAAIVAGLIAWEFLGPKH